MIRAGFFPGKGVKVRIIVKMEEEKVEFWDRASRGCNHTHSCNPPGPDHASHSHTHLIITVQYFTLHSHTHLIIIRLRTLLVEMQVKIDNELGGFSFQNQCN